MTHTEQHISAKMVVEAIGRKRLQQSLAVHKSSITGAIKSDQFHTNWFLVVEELASDAGIDTDADAFKALFPMRKLQVVERSPADV